MASSSNPRSGSSGSRNKAHAQEDTRPAGSGSRRRTSGRTGAPSSTRGGKRRTSQGAAVSGKRKSVGGKARRSSQRASQRSSQDTQRKGKKRTSGEDTSTRKRRAARKHTEGELPEGTRRVGDIRASERRRERDERAKRARAKYRRYILRILIVLAAILAVFFGCIFLYRSNAFLITNVQVEGTSHLTSQEISQTAAVPDDATLLRLDSGGIVERLKGNAWVQDAHVERVFPDTIVIQITERTPGAVVKITEKKRWVVSGDGTWLSAATKDDWKSAMRIIDVSKALSTPVSGSDCNDGGIKNALQIIGAVSPDLKEQIKSISAESSVKTSLNLKNGVTVAFGDSGDVELKEAVIWALLDKYKGKVSYINVRVPSNPTYRTLW